MSKCFYPNGEKALATIITPLFVPCNPNAAQSSCCAVGEACLNNGLCLSRTGGLYRGACTDQTWKDGACSQPCSEESGINQGSQNGYNWIFMCSGLSTGMLFSCSNCTDRDSFFSMSTGPVTGYNITATGSVGGTCKAPTSSAIPGPSPTTSQAAERQTSTASSSSVLPSSSSSLSPTLVGVTVGVPLLILFIISLAAAIWFWRQLQIERSHHPSHLRYDSFVPNPEARHMAWVAPVELLHEPKVSEVHGASR